MLDQFQVAPHSPYWLWPLLAPVGARVLTVQTAAVVVAVAQTIAPHHWGRILLLVLLALQAKTAQRLQAPQLH
jgi:hypothetical protein